MDGLWLLIAIISVAILTIICMVGAFIYYMCNKYGSGEKTLEVHTELTISTTSDGKANK
ncbi:hypothetical protein Mgra_00006741 [Meloidogyne graminicola]|uniref:Uncharacterized protein n=1 Tax=Meloidogyne graminicola TaxID=189291 RepID=A0A8S9ZKQ3_9BILA|nr:hypothetical protein Mgra_00006741 [Meloidogyne graminicola]